MVITIKNVKLHITANYHENKTMKPKFNPDFHHRKSIRLQGYDYSQEGLYFITICCQNRSCFFGEIQSGQMLLNEYGQIAHQEWLKTAELRSNIAIDEFVIMPNHMHGIIQVTKKEEASQRLDHTSGLHGPSKTIGAIIRGYKSAVTKQVTQLGFGGQLWQRNYYDHIIRSEKSYIAIRNYIINNPENWKEDIFGSI